MITIIITIIVLLCFILEEELALCARLLGLCPELLLFCLTKQNMHVGGIVVIIVIAVTVVVVVITIIIIITIIIFITVIIITVIIIVIIIIVVVVVRKYDS